jgi:hypothetical protein
VLDVLFQTLFISVIRKAAQIVGRNDAEFSEFAEREDFGLAQVIGSSAVVVGASKALECCSRIMS